MSSPALDHTITAVAEHDASKFNDMSLSGEVTYQNVDEAERAEILSVEDTNPEVGKGNGWIRRSLRASKPAPKFVPGVEPERKIIPKDAGSTVATSSNKRKSQTEDHVPAKAGPFGPESVEESNLLTPESMSRSHDGENKASSKKVKLSFQQQDDEKLEVDDAGDADFSPGLIVDGANPASTMVSPPTNIPEESLSDSSITQGDPLDHSKVSKRRSKKKLEESVESESLVQRPTPHGEPEIWAEGRQDFCETLPWHRGYQSGAYGFNGLVRGMLLDEDCGQRPYMDEEVVIMRAGGGCDTNKETGKKEQVADQDGTSTPIMSFWKNKATYTPIGCIVGRKNKHCPSEIPHRYCVMDWYQVTDIWTEKSHGRVCWKIRLEKIKLWKKSWWGVRGSAMPPSTRSYDVVAPKVSCDKCGESSKQIFEQGWICLNENCATGFWKLNGSTPPADLSYSTEFLAERTKWPDHVMVPHDLLPPPLEENVGNNADYAVTRMSWKGIVCPVCKCCNSRRLWNGWDCKTPGCNYFRIAEKVVLSPRSVLDPHLIKITGHAYAMDFWNLPIVMLQPQFLGNWRIHTYDLSPDETDPHNLISHFFSNHSINSVPGGPDDIFMKLQTTDLGLQRFPLRSGQLSGDNLTAHFAVNYGMPYKYAVNVHSKPFRDAEPVMMNALQRMTWAAEETIAETSKGTFQETSRETAQAVVEETVKEEKPFPGFNEQLVIAYFEGQKIGFHDDGEKELGPTVATMSLGGSATMKIRMKASYYFGRSGKKYDPKIPLLPGSFNYAERKRVHALKGKISAQEFQKEIDVLFEATKKKSLAPPCLTMELNHGDIIVMHGSKMQQYFEHAVDPSGPLRYALTCRHIRPELIPAEEHWKGIVPNGLEGLYHGDLNLPLASNIAPVDAQDISFGETS